MSLREFTCTGCGNVKKFTVEQAAMIPACMMCGFYGWAARESLITRGVVAHTKDGTPVHGPARTSVIDAKDITIDHLSFKSAIVYSDMPMPEDLVETHDDRVDALTHAFDFEAVNYAKLANQMREVCGPQAKEIVPEVTPAMWSAEVEKRLRQYEDMGFIDKEARVRLLNVPPPEMHVVGRVINTNENGDALVALAINQEPTMNAGQEARLSHEIETASREGLYKIAREFGVLLRSHETDEESRVRLRQAHARRIAAAAENVARAPSNPKERNACCTISCANCGHSNVYPLGHLDPKESTCTHRFRFAPELGRLGALICTTCPLRIDREDLERLNIDPSKRYDHVGNTLADATTKVHDENRDLLSENARLRRQLEALERKTKR